MFETEQCKEMIIYESGNAHLSNLRPKMFSNHSKTPLLSEVILTTRLGMCISLFPSLRRWISEFKDNLVYIEFQVNYKERPCPKINRYRQIKVAKVVILHYCNIYIIHNVHILAT